jgi:hypothetical protein
MPNRPPTPAAASPVRRHSGRPCVLTLNGGSSSIRFAVFETDKNPRRVLAGKIDRIGVPGTNLSVTLPAEKRPVAHPFRASDHRTAAGFLLDWLEQQPVFASIEAAGHRVVHGMQHTKPERITAKLLAELHRLTPYDPDHLPREIELIETLRQRQPRLPQVACFDTAFHRTMPRVAKLLPIPRRYQAKGVVNGVTVVDDYGHHPTEIAAVLAAARAGAPRRVVAVFQPHRYTRTRDLLDDFGRVLAGADVTLLTDIYAAGEAPIAGITSAAIAGAIRAHGGTAELEPSLHALPARVAAIAADGDIVLTLGAGSIGSVGDRIVAALTARASDPAQAVNR